MNEVEKRIENLRRELQELEALKARYEANPMLMLEEEVSFMRGKKDVTAKQIINTVINHVKTHGLN